MYLVRDGFVLELIDYSNANPTPGPSGSWTKWG